MTGDLPLPAGWSEVTLGSIAEVRLGKMLSAKAREAGLVQMPYLRNENVRWGFIDFSDVKQMGFKPKELDRYGVEPGDLLVCEGGEPGRAAIYSGPPQQFMYQKALHRVRLRQNLASARYVRYFFQHHAAQLRTSQTTIAHFPLERMLELRLPLAPLPEQDRIVAEIEKQFTRLDAAVAALKRLRAHLRRYRTAVLLAATEGRLVPPESELARREGRSFEDGVEYLTRIREQRTLADLPKQKQPSAPTASALAPLPEGWVWTNVNAVGNVLLGRRRAPEYLSSPHPRPYLRVANVKDDRLVLDDLRTMNWDDGDIDKYALRAGDILVSEGQSPELVGQSAIYPGGIEGLCFQATLHRFRPLPGGPSPSFAQLVFRAHVRTGMFRRVASITTNIAHLTLEKFRSAPFPLPPHAEEQRIVREAERLLSIADETEKVLLMLLDRAQALRRSILSSAFVGRLASSAPRSDSEVTARPS